MKLKRKDLFDAVWQTPVIRLAKGYGISDVGLAKACRRHEIPVPPLGYWAQVAVGRGKPRPLLSGDPDEIVEFSGNDLLKKKALVPELQEGLAKAIAVKSQTPMEMGADAWGRWTRKTAHSLDRKPDSDNFISGKPDTFRVRVSAASKDRVIRILAILESSLVAAGMEWKVEEPPQGVVGKLLNETVRFEIKETYTRQEHIEKHPKYDWMDKRTYTYHFSGDLKVSIDGWFEGRKTWSDGKTKRLEDKLLEIIEGFLAAAAAMRQRTIEREESDRRYEQEEAIRHERERIAYEQRQFLEKTLKEAKEWSEAKLIREYLGGIRQMIDSERVQLTAEGRDWLRRVDEAAKRHDPITRLLGLQSDDTQSS